MSAESQVTKGSFFPKLTLKQKILSLAICVIFGFVLEFLSYMVLFFGKAGKKAVAFAILYTIGNIVTILGMGFIVGFKSQYKSITHKNRLFASLLYFGSIILTLIVAFTVADPTRRLLLVLLIIIQYFAYIWYCLSYIPYGRTMIKKCLKSCCKVCM